MRTYSLKTYPFELVIDENGQQQSSHHRSKDAAMAAWERAANRDSVFSARLYEYQGPQFDRPVLIADHDTE